VVGKAIGNEIFSGFLEIGDYNLDLDLSEKATGQYLLKVQSEIGKTVLPIQKR
jgi:hypothetical protein